MNSTIPVFFSTRMVAQTTSFSPSASKPAQVVEAWSSQRLPVRIEPPTAATTDELTLAHDAGYVGEVLSCRRPNGFGDSCKGVASSLPWTSGSMLSAARFVLRSGGVACAPCSGFHHAGYDFGGGFCTFNGLMVTACALHESLLAPRIGILDCDMHYGNGTEDIIARLGAEAWVRHFTAGRHFHSREHVRPFFRWLDDAMNAMRDCDLLLYQAGADPHVDDPLGGWLTTRELQQRDARVFESAKRLGVPIVWNLAGGYQVEQDGSIPRVLEVHDNTMRACVNVYGRSS